ncbi:fungal specific transcription factor domain-containing protein [Sarocladium implicatum]|nr:fungal specific transcription factor domain-containing protein [Sarocladium implicatum]
MPATFTFVDNFAIDQQSRKQIRSHVMKGKNTAKARAAAGRLAKAHKKEDVVIAASSNDAGSSDDADAPLLVVTHNFLPALYPRETAPRPDALVGGALAGVRFALPMNPREQLLVKQFYLQVLPIFYPPEFCKRKGEIESPWLDMAFRDESYLFGTVAFASIFSDNASGRKKLSIESRHYLSQCMTLLNRKLSSNEAHDITCIAVILGLAMLACSVNDMEAFHVHVQGLRKLVIFRGGIMTLAHEPNLAEKVLRMDIEDALAMGLPPTFRATLLNVKSQAPIPGFEDVRFPSLDTIRSVHRDLADAAQDIQVLTRYLQKASEGPKLSPGQYHTVIVWRWCALFALSPLDVSDFSNPVAETLYLTLAALLTFLCAPNPRQYDILTRRVIYIVDKMMATGSSLPNHINPRLMNWVLHVILGSIMRGTSHAWLLPKMRQVREINGFRTWQDALASAKEYPWVPAVQDKHVQNVFTMSEPRGGPRELVWAAESVQVKGIPKRKMILYGDSTPADNS